MSFLLNSNVREPKALPEAFVDGLAAAFAGEDDPADDITDEEAASPSSSVWRLHRIETEGFGGLNAWKGKPFVFPIEGKSWLLEGSNGSGKSSLVGAILWALLGERPRDQSSDPAHEPKPVFGPDEKPLGDWPPVASYPRQPEGLTSLPVVRVLLQFQNAEGKVAEVERLLKDNVVSFRSDPELNVPSVFVDTGLLMPTRLGLLRFDEGGGQLAAVVQRLTGLDDFVAIAELVSGLCNGGREYLSSKKKEFVGANTPFLHSLDNARGLLEPAGIRVPAVDADQTHNEQSQLAKLITSVEKQAGDLSVVISGDLAGDLDLKSSETQNKVVAAIGGAQEDVALGLDGLSPWGQLRHLSATLTEEVSELIASKLDQALSQGVEAEQVARRGEADSKFQLKAVAARWHYGHSQDPITNCPLCEKSLADLPALVEDLVSLGTFGEAATRALNDNVNAILESIELALPEQLRDRSFNAVLEDPRQALFAAIQERFVSRERYSKFLTRFGAIVESALVTAPGHDLPPASFGSSATPLGRLRLRITEVKRCSEVSRWFAEISSAWEDWWRGLAGVDLTEDTHRVDKHRDGDAMPPESLNQHLRRLSEALAKAEPYRKALASLKDAWNLGKIAAERQKELRDREEIAEEMSPLKTLASLAESSARNAIDSLSGRIKNILDHTLLTENLRFRKTQLKRKEGLVVRSSFVSDLHIDATLVANTSWLRAVLWAFLFALREEAVEQVGYDPFPLYAFDDPQATFDGMHRHRWARYISSLQSNTRLAPAQVILATHDEMFRELIRTSGVEGREGMIAPVSEARGCAAIFEGASIEREWTETQRLNTDQAGRQFMARLREYVEGLLRIMLRGEDPDALSAGSGLVIGASRNKITELNQAGIPPWNRSEFGTLVKALEKNQPAVRYMEMAHHSSGSALGMAEAVDVEKHWRRVLKSALNAAFKVAREFYNLHGQLNALHAAEPSAVLPNGHRASIKALPLAVLGRAAALTGGQVADGRLDLELTSMLDGKRVVLHNHSAYRVLTATLEPVARPGDILLVNESADPLPKALVVALSDERILARRFDLAENHSDIAVLSAQTINPHKILAPVITHKATTRLRKIVGVLFEYGPWNEDSAANNEIAECNEATIKGLLKETLGLIEVVGESAVPRALNGQYLITKAEVSAKEALNTLLGRPVIVADSNDERYIKRLQMPTKDRVVLESLDIGGEFEPIVLALPGTSGLSLARVWPVAGVLFELP